MYRDKEEYNQYQRAYYKENRDWIRKRRSERYRNQERSSEEVKERILRQNLRKKYGLTTMQFKSIWDSQGGVCANTGCQSALMHGTGKYAVDHCHASGRVRGILCAQCNLALGLLGDSIQKTEGVLKYLKLFSNEHPKDLSEIE